MHASCMSCFPRTFPSSLATKARSLNSSGPRYARCRMLSLWPKNITRAGYAQVLGKAKDARLLPTLMS